MYYQPKHQVSSQVRVTPQSPPERPQNATLANSRANTRSDPQPQTAPHDADPQDSGFAMEGVYIISVAARILEGQRHVAPSAVGDLNGCWPRNWPMWRFGSIFREVSGR